MIAARPSNVFRRKLTLLITLGAIATGCQCGDHGPPTGDVDAGNDAGQQVGNGSDAGDAGSDGNGGPDAGNDAGTPIVTNVNNASNDAIDSDCDGLSDAEEFATIYAGGSKTDPGKADTDGDGIPDGVELGRTSSIDPHCTGIFHADADPGSHTLPTVADSDGDGLPDGVEDANHNGKVDPGETDPNQADTDRDGLADGAEDANHDGIVTIGETDPRNPDTDGDHINDGVEVNTTHTDPLKPDTDGDGCTDSTEDRNQNGVVDTGETDPHNGTDCGAVHQTDTDGDGLPDVVETANGTDPNNADTDGDGLTDGAEDANANGHVDPGETDPRLKDTDCDGLTDFEEVNLTYAGGAKTDPTKADTDGDGILDGVEVGRRAGPNGPNGSTIPFTGCVAPTDSCTPAVITNPTKADTDGDGISDGAEDANQNGCADQGELSPTSSTDGQLPDGGVSPAGAVCTASNLRPVVFSQALAPDLQLALPSTFGEVQQIGTGTDLKGIMGYDATNKVAFLAFREAAPNSATTPSADESAIRAQIAAQGALNNAVTNTFTTWDHSPTAFPAVAAQYDQTSSRDLKTQANSLANALIGAGSGVLNGTAGVSGNFHVQAEYIHRSNNSVVVVIALTPAPSLADGGQVPVPDGALFSMSDTAGGSAVAQFADRTAVQCETFVPSNGKVDFVFVVDDSGSMQDHQNSLGSTANAVASTLNNSQLNWRIALVTTSYLSPASSGTNQSIRRGFTRSVADFQGWLTQGVTCRTKGANANKCATADNGGTVYGACTSGSSTSGANAGCWVGTGGNGGEAQLGSARKFTNDITAGVQPGDPESVDKLRYDAQLQLILLGDADDQSNGYTSVRHDCNGSGAPCEDVNDYVHFFLADQPGGADQLTKNSLGIPITVNGIICPLTGDPNLTTGGQRYTTNAIDGSGASPYGAPYLCNEFNPWPGSRNQTKADDSTLYSSTESITYPNGQRHVQVVQATGGIQGSVVDQSNIASSVNAIMNAAIAKAGHKLAKYPIGASIKVAMDGVQDPATCNGGSGSGTIVIPRSRVNGFDFDGQNGTISFFGACRPTAATTGAAVSYQYWIKEATSPDYSDVACQYDPHFDPNDPDHCAGSLYCNYAANRCDCPADCGEGTLPPGTYCNTNPDVCATYCQSDCGGTCDAFHTCNTSTCGCECKQSASCSPGYVFSNTGGTCGCVCDTANLECGQGYQVDPNTCSCVCAADCGGCAAGTVCNHSSCTCTPIIQ